MIKAKRIYEPKKPEEQIDLQKIIANAFSSTLAQVEKWTKWLSLEIEKENNVVEKVMARISTEISKLKLDKAIVTQDIYNQLIKGVETATQEFFTLLNNHEHLEYLTQADKDECINSASEQINEAVVNFTNAFKPLSEQLDSKCDKEHTHDEYLTEADVEEMESELEEKIEAKAEKNHKHKIWDVEWLSEKIDGKAEKEHKHDEYATRQELEFIAMQKARWAGWGWHVIQTSGVVLAQRSNMNFIGATVTDDPDNNATVVTITWGSWSWDVVWPASATDWNIALYDWATGKLIKNSTYSPASLVPYTWATGEVNLWIYMLLAPTRRATTSAWMLLEASNGTDIWLLWAWNTANVTWYGSHNYDTATQDTIAIFTGSWKTLWSAALATYPSLTELAYVKWVTSAIQTQLNAKITASSTDTLTNKRITPRVTSETSSATPTINTDNTDIHRITALAANITSMTTNLSWTPTHWQKLIVEITWTATRTIAWGSSFEASTIALPTTTVSTAMLTVWFMRNSATSEWRCVATA